MVTTSDEVRSLREKLAHAKSVYESQLAAQEEESKREVQGLREHLAMLEGKSQEYRELARGYESRVVTLEKEV